MATWLCVAGTADDFTVPKKSKNLVIKQLKTESLTEIGCGLDNLIKLDRIIWELRSDWQLEFEAGLSGEGGACINHDRQTRQAYLEGLQQINLELGNCMINLQAKLNKLKNLKIKK